MMEYSLIHGILKLIIIKTFGDHSINVLALFSVYDQRKEGDYMGVVDMPFDVDWHNLGSGTFRISQVITNG